MRTVRLNAKAKLQLSDAQAQALLISFEDYRSVSPCALSDFATTFRLSLFRVNGAGNLLPGMKATRAEAAALIARFWQLYRRTRSIPAGIGVCGPCITLTLVS